MLLFFFTGLTEHGDDDEEGQDVVEEDEGELAREVEGGAELVVAALAALAAQALEDEPQQQDDQEDDPAADEEGRDVDGHAALAVVHRVLALLEVEVEAAHGDHGGRDQDGEQPEGRQPAALLLVLVPSHCSCVEDARRSMSEKEKMFQIINFSFWAMSAFFFNLTFASWKSPKTLRYFSLKEEEEGGHSSVQKCRGMSRRKQLQTNGDNGNKTGVSILFPQPKYFNYLDEIFY